MVKAASSKPSIVHLSLTFAQVWIDKELVEKAVPITITLARSSFRAFSDLEIVSPVTPTRLPSS